MFRTAQTPRSTAAEQTTVDIKNLVQVPEPIHHIVEPSLPLPRSEPLSDAFKIPIGTSAGNIFVPRVRQPISAAAAAGIATAAKFSQSGPDDQMKYYSYSIPVPSSSSGPVFFNPKFPPVTSGVSQP